MRASVARLRSSLDMAKKTASQLATSADSGGGGGGRAIDSESFVLDEQDADGDKDVMAEDGIQVRSSCSRRLLKREGPMSMIVCWRRRHAHLLQRRFGSLVVTRDSSIANGRLLGERGCCCEVTPV